MAYKDFSETIYIKTVDTSENVKVGGLKLDTSGELGHIRVLMYIAGILAGSEQIRINICSDAACTKTIYTSDWSDIADITDENGATTTGNWLGWIRTDFNKENLNSAITYYAQVELQNYTRNADTFYIGLAYDFPLPIYDNSEDFFLDHPIAMQIFTWTVRS